MGYSLLVAVIFAVQTVLLGAPACDCVTPVQQNAADRCPDAGGPCCCSIATAPDTASVPATVVTAPTVQLVATIAHRAELATHDYNPTSLRPVTDAHPASQWSAFVRAERAPPLS